VFQDFKLVNGTWDVKGVDGKVERVRPQDIKGTALMTVEGELDDISGSGQTRAAQDLCSGVPASERQHLEVEGAGHYGIFSGRRWRDIVYPQLVKFILSHAPQAKAPAAAVKPSVAAAAQPLAKSAAVTAPVAVSAAAKPATKAPVKTAAKASAKPTVKATVAKPNAKPAAKTPSKAVTKSTAKDVPNKAIKTTWVDANKKA
jgi:poly(3-hydroxybutyrate) depolymerase